MYLDAAKKQKSLKSTESLTLILAHLKHRLHCFHTVFLT